MEPLLVCDGVGMNSEISIRRGADKNGGVYRGRQVENELRAKKDEPQRLKPS